MRRKAFLFSAALLCAAYLLGRLSAAETRQAAQERQLEALTRQVAILWRQPYRITVNVSPPVPVRQAELPGFAEVKREGR